MLRERFYDTVLRSIYAIVNVQYAQKKSWNSCRRWRKWRKGVKPRANEAIFTYFLSQRTKQRGEAEQSCHLHLRHDVSCSKKHAVIRPYSEYLLGIVSARFCILRRGGEAGKRIHVQNDKDFCKSTEGMCWKGARKIIEFFYWKHGEEKGEFFF